MQIKHAVINAEKLLIDSSSPKLDTEILLAHLLNKSCAYLMAHGEKELSAEQQQQYDDLIARRAGGEPIAYIIGYKEFWSLKFVVNKDVLIPRPDTELLVEYILQQYNKQHNIRLLELGTGSGAIAIAIASERPNWNITATDNSGAALDVAKLNADANKINNIVFMLSDWFKNLGQDKFDLIVSNPPYIAEGDVHLSAIKDEPQSALVAGADGLQDIAQIIAEAPAYLNSGGRLMLEHGRQQAKVIQQLFIDNGFGQVSTLKDLGGLDRVTVGQISD